MGDATETYDARFAPGEWVYCWRVGVCYRVDDKGECPECGRYIYTHKKWTADHCGTRTCCQRVATHSHECGKPLGHDGEHDAHACERDDDNG